jgi:hypothetical protein
MNWRHLLLVVAVLFGAASGSSSLESAAASQPPITWGSLAFAFGGSLVASPLVLGFQAALGNAKAFRWGWYFFLIGAVYFTVSGIAAIVVAARGPGLAPHSFLFFAVGVAMLVGLGATRVAFSNKFANGL